MTAQCPNGHTSSTDDFCDVCGEPIQGAAASTAAPDPTSAPPPASNVTATPVKCPNCGDENPPDSLFCEACGYDFTTGQAPATPSVPGTSPATPAPRVEWVAELWVDPDWFAAQEAGGTCATSGAPTIIPLRGAQALIGRRSQSRNVAPEIDCSADGSVSHTHASLTLDHERWYVEDLGSTNGTYVGTPGDPLPTTPLNPHERHELADDERIYVGAWCRIQVRAATDDEQG